MLIKSICITIVMSLLLISGCANKNLQYTDTMQGQERGLMPDNYEKIINDYLYETLKDPFSKKTKSMSEPKEAVYIKRQIISRREIREIVDEVWHVTIDVNAKNSHGAYVGWVPYTFVFGQGKLRFVKN